MSLREDIAELKRLLERGNKITGTEAVQYGVKVSHTLPRLIAQIERMEGTLIDAKGYVNLNELGMSVHNGGLVPQIEAALKSLDE